MAKKIDIVDEMDTFDPSVSAAKLPSNIKRGRNARQDYLDIPITQFIAFQGKGKGDFSHLPQQDFDRMVESIREEGVLEAVIVRPWADDKFELLAGETRWRAAREAGKMSLPARVLTNCDDARAARIFSITNLNRRNPNLRDRLYGWYIYWENAKAQNKAGEKLLEEDIASLGPGVAQPVGDIQLRQIQKYYKIYQVMEEPFIRELESNIISMDAAYALAFLAKEQRETLIGRSMSVKQAEALKALSKQGEWTDEKVDEILGKTRPTRAPYEKSMRKAVGNFRKTVTTRLNPAQYNNVDKILEEALELYFTAHPETVISGKS